MKTDFTQSAVEISPLEIEDLRKDLLEGIYGCLIMLIIAIGFSWLFYANIPQDTRAGQLFVWVPMLVIGVFFLIALYSLYNYWRDIKNGYKVLINGTIKRKYVRVNSLGKGNIIRNLSERTRCFIIVEGRSHLIKESDYEECTAGCQVKMYVGKYSSRVFDMEIIK